jgi:hypothetical protein
MPASNKHFDSGAKRAVNRALENQVPPEVHHAIARNVKGYPEEILAFAKSNSSPSALSLC